VKPAFRFAASNVSSSYGCEEPFGERGSDKPPVAVVVVVARQYLSCELPTPPRTPPPRAEDEVLELNKPLPPRTLRNRGRRVARLPTNIPTPGSTDVHIASRYVTTASRSEICTQRRGQLASGLCSPKKSMGVALASAFMYGIRIKLVIPALRNVNFFRLYKFALQQLTSPQYQAGLQLRSSLACSFSNPIPASSQELLRC